jgi:trehalose synthase
LAMLETVVGAARVSRTRDALQAAGRRLDGRTVWHVSEKSNRGGVVEVLNTVLPYLRAEGISAPWIRLESSVEFRALTKGLYYSLAGVAEPSVMEDVTRGRALYEAACRENAARIVATARRSDLIIVHDHQTAGLLPYLRDAGYTAIWRVHVNPRRDREVACRAWDFLSPYAEAAHAGIVSTPDLVPLKGLAGPVHVLPLSIDPLAAKNRSLPRSCSADCIVARAGITSPLSVGEGHTCGSLAGSPVTVIREGDPVPPGSPLAVQISRWDRIKDIPGVIRVFVDHVDRAHGAHLALVGPDTAGDP